MIRKTFGKLICLFTGFRLDQRGPEVEKAVCIGVPHTSNWDLFHMLAIGFICGIRFKWVGKHTLFRAPFGWFFKMLGGIPIDRNRPQHTVKQFAKLFKETKGPFILAIAPEGTRRYKEYWKSGFYRIAKESNVPILMGYIDAKNKRLGLGSDLLWPSGDIKQDMDKIREFYSDKIGVRPENVGPIRLKQEVTKKT